MSPTFPAIPALLLGMYTAANPTVVGTVATPTHAVTPAATVTTPTEMVVVFTGGKPIKVEAADLLLLHALMLY